MFSEGREKVYWERMGLILLRFISGIKDLWFFLSDLLRKQLLNILNSLCQDICSVIPNVVYF